MKSTICSALIGICFAICGCFTPAMTTQYVPGTPEFDKFVRTYPEAKDVSVGSIYRLKQDLLLIGTSGRGRKSLSTFGFPGDPNSADEYWSDPGQWNAEVKGVVEKGTLFRAERIEKHSASQPSSRASWVGVALEIVDGPHRGEVIAPLGRAFTGVGIDFAVPDPEYFEKVDK